MPLERIPGIEPMSIANMTENHVTAVEAWCEGPDCHHHVSIPIAKLYEMGFRDENAVIDIGWKLRCSKCGHKGAETQPDWTTRPRMQGLGADD